MLLKFPYQYNLQNDELLLKFPNCNNIPQKIMSCSTKTISVSPGLSPIELAVFTMSSRGRMATQASPMFACRRGQLIEAGPFQLLLARCGWEIHGTMESDDTIVILLQYVIVVIVVIDSYSSYMQIQYLYVVVIVVIVIIVIDNSIEQ